MRKILVTLALLVSALYTLSAIPAYPGKIRVKQPDGSTIIIQIHGDEWLHYITDEYGRVVAQDADGFYRPAQKPTQEEQEEAAQMRRAARQMRAQAAQSLTQGRHRIPVVLVNFSDKSFIINDPATAFSNMLYDSCDHEHDAKRQRYHEKYQKLGTVSAYPMTPLDQGTVYKRGKEIDQDEKQNEAR